MRGSFDALRSLRRHTALALGDGWEIRLDDEAIVWPYVRIRQTTPLTQDNNPRIVTLTMTAQLAAYGGPQKDTEHAMAVAQGIEDELWAAFNRPGPYGRAKVVALYDYTGVDLDVAATEDERLAPCDYMRVVDFSTNQIPEPEDRRLIAVTASIRLSWRRTGEMPSGHTTLTDVPLTFETS